MASHRSLERGFQIDESMILKLKAHDIITVKDLFEVSILTFLAAGITQKEADGSKDKVASKLCQPRYCGTVLSMLQARTDGVATYPFRKDPNTFLSTGVVALDTKLRGGYKLGSINELCGPPGVGKVPMLHFHSLEPNFKLSTKLLSIIKCDRLSSV